MKIVRHNVGDEVIALTGPKKNGQPRTKGQTYIVKATEYCAKCGDQAVNIGTTISLPATICVCGHNQSNGGLHWTSSKKFVKPQELQAKIEEAVEIEDYETAGDLHKILQDENIKL